MKKLILVTFIIQFILVYSGVAGVRWEGKSPKYAEKAERWHTLIDVLLEKQLYYGALAASFRSLMFFEDIQTKEKAFKTIISLIDKGYPFSTQKIFETGDINPHLDYDLVNSYNLYKAIVNKKKNMNRWSDYFLDKVDKEKFYKYKFYLAIETYKEKKFDDAINMLREILNTEFIKEQSSFVKKVSRTLARIYFEQQKYKMALDIYESFLIRNNPIVVTDWLETAWSHYYLKNYDKALGYLYNLESKIAKYPIILEKYVLRAVIYMDLCATSKIENLIVEFNKDFGSEIKGIINGHKLRKFKALRYIFLPQSYNFFETDQTINRLKKEYPSIKDLPRNMRTLARYLYKSQFKMLKKKLRIYEEDAINMAAKELVMLSEGLKFLKYGTEREKYNPGLVFQQSTSEDKNKLFYDLGQKGSYLRWKQAGDFWRDERTKYLGILKTKCGY